MLLTGQTGAISLGKEVLFMKLSRLLSPLSITKGYQDVEISDIVYDSRKAVPGCAFVCLRGANSDGHKYAQGAAKAGAVAVIAE